MKMILFTTTGCPRCPKARETVWEIASELGWEEGEDFEEKKIDEGDNFLNALKYQVASAPSVVLICDGEGEVAFHGEAPSKEALLEEIKKRKLE